MKFKLLLLLLLIIPSQLLGAPTSVPEKMLQLREDDVRQAVEQMISSKVAGRAWETRITQFSMPSGIKVPAGTLDLEVIPSGRWDGWGPASVTLVVRVNGRLEKNLSLRINVESQAEMVVAARQIPPGTILSISDLSLQKNDVAAASGKYLASIDDAVGKKTRGGLRQNAPVRSDQLDKVHVIKSGQMITIVAESALLKITTTGRARGAGAVGDIIMVQNMGSSKEIPATVLDASTVLVGF